MSAWFVIAIILAIATLLYFIFAPPYFTTEKRPTGQTDSIGRTYVEEVKIPHSTKKYGWLGVALTLVALIFSSTFMVGAHNVGVVAEFGKPTGTNAPAGLHVKAPWTTVTDIDATVQPEEYKGETCIYVKIADAGSACISLAYRWRVNADGADVVWADYRNSEDGITEAVRKALVSTNIKAAINEVFGTYDPTSETVITPNMTPQDIANLKLKLPELEFFNKAIKANVEEKIKDLGDLIEIQSVTVSYVKLPDTTQDRINAFNAKVMDTRLALADIAIKDAQAQANNALAASLQDPNVLVSKCLDGMISGEIDAPAGFQCWGGTNSSVVIPAAK